MAHRGIYIRIGRANFTGLLLHMGRNAGITQTELPQASSALQGIPTERSQRYTRDTHFNYFTQEEKTSGNKNRYAFDMSLNYSTNGT